MANEELQRENKVLKRAIKIYQTQYGNVRFFNFDIAIKQAENEIENEENNEQEGRD